MIMEQSWIYVPGNKTLFWEMEWICLGIYLKGETVVNPHTSESKFNYVNLNALV